MRKRIVNSCAAGVCVRGVVLVLLVCGWLIHAVPTRASFVLADHSEKYLFFFR